MKHLGLFEGIGGFSLAAKWAGWETVAWCEINPFCQKVLKHHFPEAEGHTDIKETDFKKYANRIDIVTGGFPCQPYSTAGKRKGKEDERHLWPQMLRAIREVSPRWVVGENVRGLTNWNGGLVFDEVQADLETEGYQILPFLLPACAVNAPHRRDRIWFVAYSESNGSDRTPGEGFCKTWRQDRDSVKQSKQRGQIRDVANTNEPPTEHKISTGWDLSTSITCDASRGINKGPVRVGESKGPVHGSWDNFPTQSPVCGGDDGLPGELDGITFPKWRNESIKAYGNAVVPQVVYEIFIAINEYENNRNH